jgi:hypothetical protein
MRKLWAAYAAVVICMSVGTVVAVAQDESGGVSVTAFQECRYVSGNVPFPCAITASDPRLSGEASLVFSGGRGEDAEEATFVAWTDTTLEGPEGSWSGHHYIPWDADGAYPFVVLSGEGAYEGWVFIASGIDPEADGVHDLTGVLYEGPLPPFGAVMPPADDSWGERVPPDSGRASVWQVDLGYPSSRLVEVNLAESCTEAPSDAAPFPDPCAWRHTWRCRVQDDTATLLFDQVDLATELVLDHQGGSGPS